MEELLSAVAEPRVLTSMGILAMRGVIAAVSKGLEIRTGIWEKRTTKMKNDLRYEEESELKPLQNANRPARRRNNELGQELDKEKNHVAALESRSNTLNSIYSGLENAMENITKPKSKEGISSSFIDSLRPQARKEEKEQRQEEKGKYVEASNKRRDIRSSNNQDYPHRR